VNTKICLVGDVLNSDGCLEHKRKRWQNNVRTGKVENGISDGIRTETVERGDFSASMSGVAVKIVKRTNCPCARIDGSSRAGGCSEQEDILR